MEGNGDSGNGKVKWTSKFEFVVTLIGYSFGLPDIWRLPYLTYRNGGGAFLLAYILLMLSCGAPLYFLEIAMSQFSGKGPWKFWDISPLFRGFGLAVLVVNGISVIYDATMRSWIIEYLVNSFKSPIPWTTCKNVWNTPRCISGFTEDSIFIDPLNDPINGMNITSFDYNISGEGPLYVSSVEEFWRYEVLRRSSGIEDIGDVSGKYVLYHAIIRTIIFLACVKSIKSLGKVMYVTATLPVLLIVIIWIRALSLPGATTGMLYFITPDFSHLGNVKVWTEAAFMTFYTLGPGWGGLMMMGCHNEFRTNCLRAAIGTTVCTLLYGVLNGLVVFSVVGVMAYEAGVNVSSAISSGGFSIGFIAYPKALSYFPLPQLWCVLFFLVLLLPGIDAMMVETEPVMLILEENFPKRLGNKRPLLLGLFSVISFLLGIPFTTRAGVYMFQLVDWYVATWSIMLVCIGEAFVFSWIYGGHRVDRDIQLMLGQPLPAVIRISLAFIMPVFLLFLLVVSMYTYRPPTLGDYSYPGYATAIGWCLALASVIPIFVYAGRQMIKGTGTIKERLLDPIKSNEEWGPVNKNVERAFIQSEEDLQISFKRLFLFNLLGRSALKTKAVISDDQMEML